MIRSYLTGEMVPVEQGDRRPLAVMISNDKAAMPHYGMNNAGVIYEAPVEGGINRYMAIIEDYDDLERIGSVRSCRTYYTYFAKEFEAVYAHFGQRDVYKRQMFLEFFESKGHLAMKSFSLVPHNDNSLLLINSGMAPLKPYFTGQEIPPRKMCIRDRVWAVCMRLLRWVIPWCTVLPRCLISPTAM